jgi:hypothetical protein
VSTNGFCCSEILQKLQPQNLKRNSLSGMPFIQGEKQKSPQIFEDKAFSQKIVPFFTQLLLDLET